MALEKITLAESSLPAEKAVSVPAEKRKKFFFRLRLGKKTLFILPVILIIMAVLAIAIILPAQGVIASAKKTYDQGKITWEAIKKQDIGLAKEELTKTRASMSETEKSLAGLGWTQYIPLVGLYYSDAKHAIAAANSGLEAANTVVDAILPYADVLGLKGEGSFVLGSAEDRIQKAVATMDKVTPQIPALEDKMKKMEEELSFINPNRYPKKVGNLEIKDNIVMLKQVAGQGRAAVSDARPLLEVLPRLLGEPKEKKYLVLFQNDKELRASGGFITAYAVFRIEHGVVIPEGSNDIYALDATLRTRTRAPEIILKYLPLVSYFNLRDANISPDFVESMKLFEELYDKAGGKVAVDGIIAVDTHVLVTVLDILGGVEAGGVTYTTENDKRCNCPQVIYELEDYASRPVNYVRSGRKDIIGVLLYAIMRKALASSPRQYWGPLFQAGLGEISEKHILTYLHDENAQKGLESLNAAGRIKDYEGDYLHVNDSNFAGAKSNLYVQQKVEQAAEVAADGTVTKTVKIDYTNPEPPSDCNLERGELCLNGLLRDVVRVYVPKGSQLTDSKGSEVKVETKEDLGKTYFEAFITVRPQGKASLEFTYSLPFKLAKGSPYALLVQKQPGTNGNEYVVRVNNREEKFNLTTDKELKISLQ
ncbi:DUF4012 domain-containing protein [Candidatus Microgenomates bacterium]|nr:DUF4012 domain-containing protein [Candidatus Microgenomates bacterium]